jgi:hypothetical protein
MIVKDKVEDETCRGFSIGHSPILYFVSGILLILVQIILLAVLKRSRYLASKGDKRASSSLVLPIYYLIVLYMAVIGIIVGISHIIGYVVTSADAITIKWFVYRICAESLAVFLMHTGIGWQPMKRSLIIGGSWAFISSFIPYIVYRISGVRNYLIVSIAMLCILFLFYVFVIVAPSKYLNKRPALQPYAKFYCVGIVLLIIAHVFIYTDMKFSPCVVEAIEAFGDLLQPLIMYKAMYDDSMFWQGIFPHTDRLTRLLMMD